MAQKWLNGIGRIAQIIFWILLALLIIQLMLKILGKSPADITILYTGFGVIISYLLITTYNFARFMGRANEFMENTKESFKKIKEDINEIKRKQMPI